MTRAVQLAQRFCAPRHQRSATSSRSSRLMAAPSRKRPIAAPSRPRSTSAFPPRRRWLAGLHGRPSQDLRRRPAISSSGGSALVERDIVTELAVDGGLLAEAPHRAPSRPRSTSAFPRRRRWLAYDRSLWASGDREGQASHLLLGGMRLSSAVGSALRLGASARGPPSTASSVTMSRCAGASVRRSVVRVVRRESCVRLSTGYSTTGRRTDARTARSRGRGDDVPFRIELTRLQLPQRARRQDAQPGHARSPQRATRTLRSARASGSARHPRSRSRR